MEPTNLTHKQKEKAIAWIKQRGEDRSIICPICHHNNWAIGDHLVVSPLYTGSGNINFGGPSYPLAMLICQNCGQTLFLNAVMMGLLTEEDEDKGGGDG